MSKKRQMRACGGKMIRQHYSSHVSLTPRNGQRSTPGPPVGPQLHRYRPLPTAITHRVGLGFFCWVTRTIKSRFYSNGQCIYRELRAIQRQDFESDAASAAPPPSPPCAQSEAQARVTARCPRSSCPNSAALIAEHPGRFGGGGR